MLVGLLVSKVLLDIEELWYCACLPLDIYYISILFLLFLLSCDLFLMFHVSFAIFPLWRLLCFTLTCAAFVSVSLLNCIHVDKCRTGMNENENIYIHFWRRYVLIRIFSSVYLLLPPLIYHSYSPPQLTSSSSFLLPSNGESYSPFNIVSFPSSSLPPGTSFYSHPPLPFSSSSAVRWKVRHCLPRPGFCARTLFLPLNRGHDLMHRNNFPAEVCGSCIRPQSASWEKKETENKTKH